MPGRASPNCCWSLARWPTSRCAGNAKRIWRNALIGYTDIGARPQAGALFARLLEPVVARGQRSQRGRPAVSASSWRIPCKHRRRGFRRSAGRRRRAGRSNGNGMAFAPSWCAGPSATWVWSRGEELVTERFPNWMRLRRTLTGRHRPRTAKSSIWQRPDACSLSPICSSGWAARLWGPSCWPTRRPSCWPTTCWSWHGEDWRGRPQAERRAALERPGGGSRPDPALVLTPLVAWQGLAGPRRASGKPRGRWAWKA